MRWLLAIAVILVLIASTFLVFAQPSQQELRHRYGHRTVASVTCQNVRQAVALYGRQAAEATALQYGMTPNQHRRALNCLTIRNRR